MKTNFNNKIVLVTGGSRGIGLEISQSFFTKGAAVYRTSTKNIKKINGVKKNNFIKTFKVNFNKELSTKNFLKKIGVLKKIDVLINNAGINKIDPIDKINDRDWDEIHNVNLKVPFQIIKVVSKKMKKNGSGKIVNIASIFSEISKSMRASYSSSKFGLVGLTKAAALDLAPNNILVNSVSPGFVKTDLTKEILSKKEMSTLESQIPLKKMAETKDIVSIVLFLSSELNSYITGQNILIDGGFSIK